MTTSREVFAMRKEGALDEAYKMALELIKIQEKDDWDIKAFGWCLVDLIKRDAKSGHQQNLAHYAQQLEDLKIDPSDNILTEQRQYALKLCNPSGRDILKAKGLSKQEKHLDSLNIYKKIFKSGDQSKDVQTSLAWEQYHVAKTMIEQDPPNFNGAKIYLNDYLKLKIEKPSLLHSRFLWLADGIAKEDKLNMGSFARIWKLEYLRPDDYERFRTNDGKEYSSLAEKVVQRASKDAFSRDAQEDLHYILPFINDCVVRYPDNLWLKQSKAKVLMAIGRTGEALPFGLEVVKNKVNEYWAWELLGDIHQPASPKAALSCYCKALLCSKDIKFIGKVKIKLAELLVKNSSYPQAKLEIDEVVGYRIKNNQKAPKAAELLKGEPWYETETAAVSNQELYIKNASMAEELLYADLKELIGVVDNVNQEKKLLHFIVSRNIDGIIKFSDLSDKFDEGDAIAVRVSKYTGKQGTYYRALTSCRTTKAIPESLVKPFEDSVREENGMGFTDSGIFIPPPMVRTHNIKSNDYVSGQAILNYNKKRSEWGWKAISINNVCST